MKIIVITFAALGLTVAHAGPIAPMSRNYTPRPTVKVDYCTTTCLPTPGGQFCTTTCT